MSRIVFTFDAEWDHKDHKRLESRVEQYHGRLIPPNKRFDFFTVDKDGGGMAYIPTINLEKIETFPDDADG